MFPLLLPLRLWPYFRSQRWRSLLALLTVLPDPLLMVGIPVLLQLVIDRSLASDSAEGIGWLLLLPCLWLLVAVACNGASVKLFAALGSQLGTDFRRRLFRQLLEQPAAVGDGGEQGLLAQQIPTLENVVVVQLPLFVWTMAQIVLGVLLLFRSDWRLALLAVLLTPLLLVSQVAFTPPLARREQERVARAGLLLGFASERLRSRELVDLFGLRPSTRQEFARRNLELRRWAQRVGTLSGLQSAALTASALLTLVSVFAVGTWLVKQQQLSVGQLVAAMGIATAMVSGMWQLGTSLLPLQAGTTALNLLEQQLPLEAAAARADSAAAPPLPDPPTLQQQLSLRAVYFRYPEGGGLSDFDLTIPANSSLALVGPRGGGKSTVLRLLLRQLLPQSGQLRVDDVDLLATDRERWLEQVALVPQDTVLFELSIAENIRLGRLEASDAEVREAAEAAELGGLIDSLPQGLDTPVGPGGGRLSGGQRQRIAIARAIVRNPRLLLLDEATSALDPSTEEAINATLVRLGQGRTVVSVLHRLRAAAAMDQVAVIADGRVVEQGHHNALLAAGGLYASFWHRQMSGFDVSAGHRVRITAERLATIPLFHGVDGAMLGWLASNFVSERVRPGEEVFCEGDPPDSFYVVVAGTLEMLQADLWGGLPVKQGVLEEGDFFGDAGLLEDLPRAVTVRARGDGLLLRLDRDRFLDLLEKDPDYRRFFHHSAQAYV